MKILSLIGACLATLLTGCSTSNNGVRVLDHINSKVAHKNSIITSGTNSFTFSYTSSELGLGSFNSQNENAYQYVLIGENYFYKSNLYLDTYDDIYYVFSQDIFKSNQWIFGFYDYYLTYDEVYPNAYQVFMRTYFCRKNAVVKYYIEDSLNRYFYDNNAWNDYYCFLAPSISIMDLANIGDLQVNSVNSANNVYSFFYNNRGSYAIQYYPTNQEITLHNIDDDDYPFFGSGFNYYLDSNVCFMNNMNSFMIYDDNLNSLMTGANLELSFVFESNDYEQGYKAGYDLGTDEGYTEGYSDGQQHGVDVGYEDGYDQGHIDGFAEGYYQGQENGYDDGFAEGKQEGYTQGYNAGAESANHYTFGTLFSSIADTPVLIFRQLFSFDLFGVSALTVILSLFTVLVVLFIAKKIIK